MSKRLGFVVVELKPLGDPCFIVEREVDGDNAMVAMFISPHAERDAESYAMFENREERRPFTEVRYQNGGRRVVDSETGCTRVISGPTEYGRLIRTVFGTYRSRKPILPRR